MRIAILIDFDNMTWHHQSLGILDCARRVLDDDTLFTNTGNIVCDVRVYGGWYENDTLTKRAQDVARELGDDFPAAYTRTSVTHGKMTFRINAEMAYALIEAPRDHLLSTFKRRSVQDNVRINQPEHLNCQNTDCMLVQIDSMLKTKMCPISNCDNNLEDMWFRSEQKQVDTMLTCDILHSHNAGYELVVVLSSDDDFLPPLLSLKHRGQRAIRVHTKQPNRRRRPQFGSNVEERLLQ